MAPVMVLALSAPVMSLLRLSAKFHGCARNNASRHGS